MACIASIVSLKSLLKSKLFSIRKETHPVWDEVVEFAGGVDYFLSRSFLKLRVMNTNSRGDCLGERVVPLEGLQLRGHTLDFSGAKALHLCWSNSAEELPSHASLELVLQWVDEHKKNPPLVPLKPPEKLPSQLPAPSKSRSARPCACIAGCAAPRRGRRRPGCWSGWASPTPPSGSTNIPMSCRAA